AEHTERGLAAAGERRYDASERHLWVPAVVGDRSVWPAATAARGDAGARVGQRAGPPGRACHARRRRGAELLPAARARSSIGDRTGDAADQRRDGYVFSEPARRRRIEPPRAGTHRSAEL